LKWDWEITHDGRKAYGVLLHQKYQVHNTASHANQIWGYYEYTRDRDFLRTFYPLLEGIARFFADCIVQEREGGGFEVGFQVGVHESPEKVRNDGINLAGTIAVLRHCAQAAAALGIESDFSRRCNVIAEKMMSTVDALYNGRHFVASEEGNALNMSSLAPVYPMQVVPFNDPRAQSTAHAFLEQYGGRMVGHGGNQSGFPWAAGVLATIFARQGQGDEAWQILQSTRPAICSFGGMSEVVENGAWNMQYFGTAEGAVGTAIHSLLLHPAGDTIRLFPALPRAWRQAAFAGLLAGGVAVSARFDAGRVHCCLRNLTTTRLERRVQVGGETKVVQLSAEEEREVSWTA
jgi:alpha-L-fucosidase 2